MVEHTELYNIVTGYTYLGIVFYYIIFDFISPISDELSLILVHTEYYPVLSFPQPYPADRMAE